MASGGIDTRTFKTHSVRGASTLSALMHGVTTEDSLNAADWSTECTFYYKQVCNTVFAKFVLGATTAQLICETEPSEV